MDFCSRFDELLAEGGPPAVFLPDPVGALRFDASWTRDAWGRAEGPHQHGWRWTLLRDRGSGFVLLALVTSPTLLQVHPRLDVRAFESLDEARAMRASFGDPALCQEAW